MLARVHTGAVRGVDALLVTVEVALASALPSFSIVGLAQGSVREGRERVAAALRSTGLGLPNRRITVNLAPADVRKEGTAFDLPIAVGVLAAAGQVPDDAAAGVAVLGELGLDGSVRPVPGVLPVTLCARAAGLSAVLVPAGNADEAAMVEGIAVLPVAHLASVVDHLRGEDVVATHPRRGFVPMAGRHLPDLADVRGQGVAKRALEVAAAGGHNLLMVGPPGAGKTMLARRLPGILPPLVMDEAIEVARIHSVAGCLTEGRPTAARPFRAPHHSVSYAGLVGGGTPLRPGEASLAHRGVLFLDELPEYRRNVIEVLRQPLEEGNVVLSRAGGTVTFPARFQLVAAMNPCPCGFQGTGDDRCLCDPTTVQRYRGRVSGPLLDRIDLVVEMPALAIDEMMAGRRPPSGGVTESSRTIASRVLRARASQAARSSSAGGTNAHLTEREVRSICRLDKDGERLLRDAMRRAPLSARGYDRILKVARTIADLDGCEGVGPAHVAEALQYRLGSGVGLARQGNTTSPRGGRGLSSP